MIGRKVILAATVALFAATAPSLANSTPAGPFGGWVWASESPAGPDLISAP